MTTRTPAPYWVVGAGAIGGTLAHALTQAGHQVTVVDTDAAHVAAIRADGLRIRRPDGRDDVARVAAAHTPDDLPADSTLGRVIVATKSQHTADAAAWVAPRLAPDGFVLSAQNGHNEPVLAEHVGSDRVLGAFVNIFADWLEPGVVRDGGRGALAVGLPGRGTPDSRVLSVAEDLRAYGPVSVTANLEGYRWAKAGFGAVLGVTTLVDAPIAEVVDARRDVVWAVAHEATEQALRAGVVLEAFDAYEPYAFSSAADEVVRDRALNRLVRWLRGQPKDRSGVFRDIAVRGREREHGPGRAGPGDDVPTPLLAALGSSLDDLAAGRREFGWSNVDELRALLAPA
ncbi:2-dehydropantoate 2-reductase N-terminal domain-containing protein [Isoptericola sp. F-RaC21]|uniref:ketopantoate reductase family protein n=1 Tax=Isoptericola sp. F-RaC21 TaxID=3141452 RepID=UPI00315B667E